MSCDRRRIQNERRIKIKNGRADVSLFFHSRRSILCPALARLYLSASVLKCGLNITIKRTTFCSELPIACRIGKQETGAQHRTVFKCALVQKHFFFISNCPPKKNTLRMKKINLNFFFPLLFF